MSILKKALIAIVVCIAALSFLLGAAPADAKPPMKSKFYDFSDQLIDGEIRKPTTLYTDARQKVKFSRLLRLKRSFMRELFDTAKSRVFK